MKIFIPCRGNPTAAATTLGALASDAPDLVAPGSVVLVDDRSGHTSTGALANLAGHYGAAVVAADEFAGWAAIDLAVGVAGPGSMMIVEAGVVVSVDAIRAARHAVEADAGVVYLAASDGDRFGFDAVVLDRSLWPQLPPLRGFGGVGDALERHWRARGLDVRPLNGVRRTVLVEVAAKDAASIRNALVAEHWLDGDHGAVVRGLGERFDPELVAKVAERFAAELSAPMAGIDAIYWLPAGQARGGWPAAEAAFAAASIDQLVRRLPRLEVSLVGQLREALIVGTIARRAAMRGWSRVVIISGPFELGPFEGEPLPTALTAPGLYAGDLLFLDDTVGATTIRHPLAAMLGPACLHMLATEIPARAGEVASMIDRGWRLDGLLAAAINAGAIKAATLDTPLIRHLAPAGDWLRW
jgi:hypothetical protein